MAHGNPGRKVAGHLNDRHDFHFFMCFPFYPCALKQRFNRLPQLAKPVFFAWIFVQV
jgi:hypothetical protein